jgi:folate-binding protein YgfZ
MTRDAHFIARECAFFAAKPAAWLRVTGEDAFAFLQGQLTNDLRKLETEPAVYGLWLNHKGRVVGDGFVARAAGGGFWVGSYFTAAAALRAHLESFIVADDVAIEDATADWRGVTWIDGAAPAAPAGVVVFSGRRGVEPATEWVYPAEADAAVQAAVAGARAVGADEMERRRIEAAIPAVPPDLGAGDLPNEGGLETVAIAYTKGCYLGQEVMARLYSMGQVRRRLMRVRGSGAAPAVPAALWQDGRKVAELRSVAADGDGFIGLALVTLLHVKAGAALRLAEDGTGGEVGLEDEP